MKKTFLLVIAVALSSLVLACSAPATQTIASQTTPNESPPVPSMQLTSPAFKDGQNIPEEFTCDSEDASPPLFWSGAPAGTKSFVLVVDDIDVPGGDFNHWLVYNLAADSTGLLQNARLPQGALIGKNSFGNNAYDGPCPPSGGSAHHYVIKVYALDKTLNLSSGASEAQVMKQVGTSTLAIGQLTGLYQTLP